MVTILSAHVPMPPENLPSKKYGKDSGDGRTNYPPGGKGQGKGKAKDRVKR